LSATPDPTWNEVLQGALAGISDGEDGASLFLEKREDLRVEVTHRTRPGSTHTHSSGIAATGAFDEGRLAYQADPVPEDAERLLRSVLDDGPWLPESRSRGPTEPSPSMLAPDEPSRLVSELVDRTAQIQPGTDASASWVGFEQQVRIARPDRPVIQDVRSGARIRVDARLSRGGVWATATAESVLSPDRASHRERVIGLAHQIAERLERRLDARHAPSGEHTIVFAPGVGGVLIHEIVGHALEADAVMSGNSWLIRFKERWIPVELTVVDDPRRGRAAWRVDDEGEPARATPLLRGGRVSGWLHDRRSAGRSGLRPTGHGRRAAYCEPVRPRMGATFAAAGALSPEEILEGVRKGIYVRRMEAASTDPRRGRAVFRVSDADLIRSGRLEQPLHPHLLHVDGPKTLRNVTGVADDLLFDTCIGSCHRDGQALAISVGAPTICIGVAEVAP
jgi:predicted Zn-dependent protease